MRILVIDDEKDFRRLVWWSFSSAMKDAEVVELDPRLHARPGDDYEWSRYDVVLLDHDLGEGECGLEWLDALRLHEGLPPTIMMTDDDRVALEALKRGAAGHVGKSSLTSARLIGVVRRALDRRSSSQTPGTDGDATPGSAVKAQRKLIVSSCSTGLPKGVRGYRVQGLIGEGGTSKVYLAEREGAERLEVLKIIDIKNVDDGSVLERFVREAELISKIRSPHVVTIYRQGFTGSYAFMAMEVLSGGNLKERISEGVNHPDALRYLRQIAYALDAIHSAGVIHRDLKPSNLMFRDEKSLVLADFGIAKRLSSSVTLTHVGEVIGTPYYMSPEQARGLRVDVRSDVYSTGAIFFEMLTGRRPFTGKTPIEMIQKHINDPIPPLPDALRRYEPLVLRLLAKVPEKRYQSAAEILDSIASLA
jgi:serine/threonine-protein kinase PpkA